jgi:hypothetical protein
MELKPSKHLLANLLLKIRPIPDQMDKAPQNHFENSMAQKLAFRRRERRSLSWFRQSGKDQEAGKFGRASEPLRREETWTVSIFREFKRLIKKLLGNKSGSHITNKSTR